MCHTLRIVLHVRLTYPRARRIGQHSPALNTQSHPKLFQFFGAKHVIRLIRWKGACSTHSGKLNQNQLKVRRKQWNQLLPQVAGYPPPMNEKERISPPFYTIREWRVNRCSSTDYIEFAKGIVYSMRACLNCTIQ